MLHLSTPVPYHENFQCGPHISFPAGPDSAPSTRPGVKMTVPLLHDSFVFCQTQQPGPLMGHSLLKRVSPTVQYSIPAQSHSSADTLHGFEDSLETGRKLNNAHNMNFSFFLQSILLSASIKREGDSPTASPHSSDDIHHSDRYQVSRQMLLLISALNGEPAHPSAHSSLFVTALLLSVQSLPWFSCQHHEDMSTWPLTGL